MIPKVSIIVPCYGVEKYLDRCMKSLVNQTLQDIEIIMIDDKSPDRVPEMCDEWGSKDSRIKVIHKPVNEGLGFARNTGLEIASGEYVAFVDSDDYLELDAYSQLYQKAKENDVDTVLGGHKKRYSASKFVEFADVSSDLLFTEDNLEMLRLGIIASPPNVKEETLFHVSAWRGIYKREIFEKFKILFKSERDIVSEDRLFLAEYLQHSCKVCVTPYNFYVYCTDNDASLTHTFKIQKFYGGKKLRDLLLDLTKNSDPQGHRSNRWYIANARALAYLLVSSSNTNKINEFKELCDDDWKQISTTYNYSYLPKQASLIYWLMSNNHPYILFLVTKVASILKSLIRR